MYELHLLHVRESEGETPLVSLQLLLPPNTNKRPMPPIVGHLEMATHTSQLSCFCPYKLILSILSQFLLHSAHRESLVGIAPHTVPHVSSLLSAFTDSGTEGCSETEQERSSL